MKKDTLQFGAYSLSLFLCGLGLPIGLSKFVFQEGMTADLRVTLGLLFLNYGIFMAFFLQSAPLPRKMGPAYGLLLITLKLFVNTFTIFLFIGLQAVRTHVFVPLFFTGYGVLLFGGVLLLHWNSQRH